MKNKTDYRVGVGASSILLMLVVLALTALSLLALGSARNNATLADRDLHMTLAYYEAAAQVQRDLCTMDALLASPDSKTSTMADAAVTTDTTAITPPSKPQSTEVLPSTESAAWQTQFDMHELSSVTVHTDLTYTLTVDAGESRVLVVEGQLYPGASTRYTVTRHELVNMASYEEPTLQLLLP